jgi:hypothetical protein
LPFDFKDTWRVDLAEQAMNTSKADYPALLDLEIG